MADAAVIARPVAAPPAPARVWRNKWRSRFTWLIAEITGKAGGCAAPDEFITDDEHPSAEIAEQKARESLDRWGAKKVAAWDIAYVGPVPAGAAS